MKYIYLNIETTIHLINSGQPKLTRQTGDPSHELH